MELVLFVGLQASGKSTFYHKNFAETHVHISKDLFRNNKRPQRRQMRLLEEALQENRDVVVDNTNPTYADREPLYQMGRQYNAKITVYFFHTTVQESKERNNRREGKARVPDVAIHDTIKRLQPPIHREDFDTLYEVWLNNTTGEFQVEESCMRP